VASSGLLKGMDKRYKIGELVMIPDLESTRRDKDGYLSETQYLIGIVIAGPADSTKQVNEDTLYMDLYPDNYLVQVGDETVKIAASLITPVEKLA